MAHINGRSTFLLLLVYLDIVTAHSVLFDAVEAQTFGLSYLKSMYTLGISLDSAGVVGMSIGWLVVRGIGKTGLLIACAAILLISLMLLLNSPMSGIVDRRREKKYRAAMERAAEREAEEAAARERQEMQMQIRQAESDDSLHNRGRRRAEKRRKVLPQTDPFHRKAPAVQEKEERMPAGISGYEAPTCFRGETSPDSEWPSLTDNKRHIIEYMNDDSLFERAPAETEEAAEEDICRPDEFSGFSSGYAAEKEESETERKSDDAGMASDGADIADFRGSGDAEDNFFRLRSFRGCWERDGT